MKIQLTSAIGRSYNWSNLLQLLPLLLLPGLVLRAAAYSKVSRNGQEARSSAVGYTISPVVFYPAASSAKTTRATAGSGRAAGDGLRPGEAIDHPVTAGYSTLDNELLAQLDGHGASPSSSRTRAVSAVAQDRFHPGPVNFVRQQQTAASFGPPRAPPTQNGEVVYAGRPLPSLTYDYPSFDGGERDRPPPGAVIVQKQQPKPTANSFSAYTPTKQLQFPSTFNDGKPPSPSSASDFNFDRPPKSVELPSSHHHQNYDNSYSAENAIESHYSPHHEPEIIYDHELVIPDDDDDDDHNHHHHHHYPHSLLHHHPLPLSTEPPEPMDQRLVKRPYSYYYIGRKLWYVPLYFSIYFIIYVAALVLKSVARHKINFPANLAAAAAANAGNGAGNGAAGGARSSRSLDGRGDDAGWMGYVVTVLDAVERYGPSVMGR